MAEPMQAITLEFAGELHRIDPGTRFIVGREGHLRIDDNQYLHRAFLQIFAEGGLWWLANVGSTIAASVSSADGTVQSWLSPGARLPLVFPDSTVVFSAGPTTYELLIAQPDAQYDVVSGLPVTAFGETTRRPVSLTPAQRLLIVSLAEPMLRREGVSVAEMPTSQQAAARLGWTSSRFNRKLDNVCDKLDRYGVQGLRGGAGRLASNRKARLVEYAVMSNLITRTDLELLDDAALREATDRADADTDA
ncbi:hypothetical protein [Agrococcus sp. KRD186]|jgi:hypothetical protein|uniref:hypothetical protein n=1 Tax=Agrococcus sp. KRD186 TaxID=2729730 RepID=UPI001F49A587|nr:hypothetical protein [Agrococcus sp. KRD186]